jgi:peptidoglycan/LPS O-acetylase OafA/YrhL
MIRKIPYIFLVILALSIHIVLMVSLRPNFFSDGNYLMATIVIIIRSYAINPNILIRRAIFDLAAGTYGFYLLHTFFISFLISQTKNMITTFGLVTEFLIAVITTALTIFLSLKVYCYLEKPLLEFSRKIK